MTDADAFLMGSGVRSAKFDTAGKLVVGTIVHPPELQQQRDFTTQELKFWSDGRPMQHLKVVLQTDEHDQDDPDDDGQRAVYVRANLQKAISAAVKKAGAAGLAPGGRLAIQYTGDAPAKQRGMSGAKLYRASYQAPTEVVAVPEPEEETSTDQATVATDQAAALDALPF